MSMWLIIAVILVGLGNNPRFFLLWVALVWTVIFLIIDYCNVSE